MIHDEEQRLTNEWLGRKIAEYRQQRVEEVEWLCELGNDHSLENIRRVARRRILKELPSQNQKSSSGDET